MQSKKKLKQIFITSFFILLSITSIAFSARAEGEIQVYDTTISNRRILRESRVSIHATLANLGNETMLVYSLNAEFKNQDNITRFDKTYSLIYDLDHRELAPGESLTGSLQPLITNTEGFYNVKIYFVATDVYSSDNPLGEAPAINFTTGSFLEVEVYDRANASGIVAGIGFTFLAIVGAVVLFILYGWIKDLILKKKYE